MEVHEGDKIVFEVNNIVKSLEYQLVIRYEPQLSRAWDDVRITVTRPQPVNQNGPCSNTIPQVGSDNNSLVVVCDLEWNGTYTVTRPHTRLP